MSKILDKFIEMSELVSNTNRIIEKEELEKTVTDGNYEYIKLNILNSLNKNPIVGKDGIQNAIVEADFAIAETGSVILADSSEEFRRATSLCENLHVVLPLSKIVRKLEDTAETIKKATKEDTGAFVAFITGASRTADIEMSLSLGVHGPQTMNILIIKDL